MLTASFPPGHLDWFVWLALVPLLWSLKDETPGRAFKLGLVTGFAHYMTLIYWIVVVLKHYGGLPFVISLAVLVIFSVYLALFPAFFSYLIIRFKGSRLSVFPTAAVWVIMEFLRARLLTGFPWCLLGYSQYRHLGLIQIADLIGVYGISFLILLSNALLYILLFDRQSIRKIFFLREIPVLLVLAVFVLFYGHYRLSAKTTEGRAGKSMRVAIIQGNIDQSVKWDPAYQEKTINIYERLTMATRPYKPNLVIWPETALPFFFQANRELSPLDTRTPFLITGTSKG